MIKKVGLVFAVVVGLMFSSTSFAGGDTAIFVDAKGFDQPACPCCMAEDWLRYGDL